EADQLRLRCRPRGIQKKSNVIWFRRDVTRFCCRSRERENSCLTLQHRSRRDHTHSMLRGQGAPLVVKVGPSDQPLRLEMGKGSREFARRGNRSEGRANGDRRSRQKTERCLWPIRQEKRYAILLAKPNGTERVGVLVDFSVQPRIRQGWASRRQQGDCGRITV